MVATAKGSFGKVDDFTPRPNDDDLWPEGSEVLPVVPWSTFFQIWKDRLPKLRIRNSCEDTCPECFILRNRFRYKSEKANTRQQLESESDESESSSSDESEFSDEELIARANLHVEQAKAQRLYINDLKTVAEAEKENEHSARRFVTYFRSSLFIYFNNFLTQFPFLYSSSYCMGVDYAQNMDIPHFGEEQPADIYYFSPLTVNVFGCTDLTSKPTQMKAYGYTEAEVATT